MDAKPEITEDEEKQSSSWSSLFVWPLVIFVMYVASVGPVLRLSEKGHWNQNGQLMIFCEAFYSPLVWTYEHTPPLRKPLDWYVGLWNSK